MRDEQLIVGFVWLVGIAISIFWMIVGWRAMRAHERIAEIGSGWLQIRREERIIALRKEQVAQKETGEDKFVPHKDAPPELPWTKEI